MHEKLTNAHIGKPLVSLSSRVVRTFAKLFLFNFVVSLEVRVHDISLTPTGTKPRNWECHVFTC